MLLVILVESCLVRQSSVRRGVLLLTFRDVSKQGKHERGRNNREWQRIAAQMRGETLRHSTLQFFVINTSITVFVSKLSVDYTINVKMTAVMQHTQQCHSFKACLKNRGLSLHNPGPGLGKHSIQFRETTQLHKEPPRN